MEYPRLILADGLKEETIPTSIVLMQAMRNTGMNAHFFLSARPQEDLRLLSLLSEQSVYCLDLYTALSAKNVKTLFMRNATPDGLNVLSVPLGYPVDDRTFQTYPEVGELAEALDCGVVLVLPTSNSNSAVTSTNHALSALSAIGAHRVTGVLFSSLKSTREYQLLEQECSRRSPLFSFGYVPQATERKGLTLEDMGPAVSSMKLLQVRSAALQLANVPRQVEWQALEAMGHLFGRWTPPAPMHYSSKLLTVAVVGQNISLEGDGNLDAFRLMGCTTMPYDPRTDAFPHSADVLYFPHSLINMCAERVLENPVFREGMEKSLVSNKLILATGASSVLFGQHYKTKRDAEIPGLGLFPYHAYASKRETDTIRRVELRGDGETHFLRLNEKMRGYEVSGFAVANPGNVAKPVFSYRYAKEGAETGLSGWNVGYCLVTHLRLDLWSAMDALSRWLALRKR